MTGPWLSFNIEDHMSDNTTLLTLTADIVAAHLANNAVGVTEVPSFVRSVHDALLELTTPATKPQEEVKPAVSIRSSVKPDHVVCLDCGAKLKMLKRHLAVHHGMTPGEYRKKWNLSSDYPVVAPNYAEDRKNIALKSGLGRKPAAKPAPQKGKKLTLKLGKVRQPAAETAPQKSTPRRARKPISTVAA
jgi:predicted transcriptional regulator